MKKIIIAILLVFSCGILALTIPKLASAETVLNDKLYAITLDHFDDDTYTFTINLDNTLIFENVNTNQSLYLNLMELEFYYYIDYLYIDGEQMQDEYLYYMIEGIYLEMNFIENGVSEYFGINLFTSQGNEFSINSGISVADFESATRDISNAMIAQLLTSTLAIENDGQLVFFDYEIAPIYPTGHIGSSTVYSYDWDPSGDDGISIYLPSNRFEIGINNIVPHNVQGYKMRYDILTYNREHGTTINKPVYVTDGNFLDFIQEATTGFLETEIFGTISIADILLFIVSIALLIFLLRFFAGG